MSLARIAQKRTKKLQKFSEHAFLINCKKPMSLLAQGLYEFKIKSV